MRISLFSKLVLDHPAEEALRVAAGAGFDGIELVGAKPHLTSDLTKERLLAIKKLSTDLHLPIVSIPNYVGGYTQVNEEEALRRLELFKAFVRMADLLDCRYVRHIPSNVDPQRATHEDWEHEMLWLRREADYAAGYGISLVLEMHEGSLIANADSTQKYIALSGLSNLAVTYDVGNIYMAHADYGVEALRKIDRYVYVIHVRDHAAWNENGKALATFMGQGVIDYVPIIKHLRDIGFAGYLSSECELFAKPVAALLSYWVPTTDLSSTEIVTRECAAIKALRDRALKG